MIAAVSGYAFGDERHVEQLAALIDEHVDRRLNDENVHAAEVVSDPKFLRRVTLDLAGRIPTARELESFLESDASDKRGATVKRLLDSPDFAYHQRNELDLLLQRRQEYNRNWREYLLEATRENRPWDRMFREILAPGQALPQDRRPAAYLRARVDDLDTVTNDTSILWFGVNVACAKCHDHPLVFDWTQAHYYGLASFFKRSYRTRAGFLGERFRGQLKYTTTAGEEHDAEFQFLSGETVDEPDLKLDGERLKQIREAIKQAERDDSAEAPPQPEFRPRQELVELALADRQQRFFAKNIVNRIWARLLGRGLVHPLDQMHSENPPSHPALLKLLSDDLIANGYDLKRLIQAIVLTKTYARNTWHDGLGERPPEETFAVARPRPLSPHQLSLSWKVASTSPEALAGWTDAESWPEERQRLEDRCESVARRLAIPDDRFQVPITEALWFSNNPSVRNDYLDGGAGKLVGHLKTVDDDAELSGIATRAVLSRNPTAGEVEAMAGYLAERKDRREAGIRQLVWALMSSPEFRFNH